MPRPQMKVRVNVDESDRLLRVDIDDGLTTQVGPSLPLGDGEGRKTSVVIPFPTTSKFPERNARENEELFRQVLDTIERVERFSLARIGEVERQLRGAFNELRAEVRRANEERGYRNRSGHLGDVIGSWWCTDPLVRGEPLHSLRLKELIDSPEDFTILVVDRGEFEARSIGTVYLNGCELRRFSDGSTKINPKPLSVLLYRILVRALKECGGPVDPPELAKLWWKDKDKAFANRVSKKWADYRNEVIKYDEYREAGRAIEAAAERLSSILETQCQISFQTFRQGPYRLWPIRRWAYVELRQPLSG